MRLETGDELTGDELLVAVGRRPATRELGLETVGLEPGRYVEVDDRLRVRRQRLALRDRRRQRPRAAHAHGQVPGAHRGRRDPRPRRDGSTRSAGGPLSPRVVFTDPQVAAVGHTLESAQRGGHSTRAPSITETSGVAGGSFYGRGAPGTSRLVVDEERRVLVGATFIGPDVAEFVHAATVADRRRGDARPALARDAVVPDAQRGLAPAARDLRPLESLPHGRATRADDEPEAAELRHVLAEDLAGRAVADVVVERPARRR